MRSLTLKLSVMAVIALLFAGCDNSTGPVIVNNVNTGNHAPGAPNSPSPADSLENATNIITLSWHCTDPDAGDTLRYDVYFSIDNPPSGVAGTDLLNPSLGYGVVDHNTRFFWRVKAKDNHGASTWSPVWTFKTAP